MPERVTYVATCPCGSVKIDVDGPPAAAGLCHCESCRRWHAAPVNAWGMWPGDSVTVTEGADLIREYDTGTSRRQWCNHCGAGLMNRKPNGMIVVYAMALTESSYVHEPTMHIHYGEAVLDISDGLPKFVDLPTERHGSGELAREPQRSGMGSARP